MSTKLLVHPLMLLGYGCVVDMPTGTAIAKGCNGGRGHGGSDIFRRSNTVLRFFSPSPHLPIHKPVA